MMHWDWAYDGVNASVPRNAGPECRHYLSTTRIIIECICITLISICAIKRSWSNIIKKKSLPDYNVTSTPSTTTTTIDADISSREHLLYHQQTVVCNNHNNSATTQTIRHYYEAVPAGKQILLIIMTFILGLEMGFKFASRSVVYILNPCHITTMIQIYLLAASPSKTITILFRIQMNFLNGPFLAFVFPETDSRQFTLEASTYWIQHALMCIIPVYLLRLGGVYNMEAVTDINWNILSYAFLLIYHFTFLQILSVPTEVNLNHMLCPAILDPFEGANYRIAAVIHQGILCPLLCKLTCLIFEPAKNKHKNNNYHPPSTTTTTTKTIAHHNETQHYNNHNNSSDKSNNNPAHHHSQTTTNGRHLVNSITGISNKNTSTSSSQEMLVTAASSEVVFNDQQPISTSDMLGKSGKID